MVLETYKRYKNRYINPLESKVGDKIKRISYLDDTLPNIFWVAYMYSKLGLNKTLNLVTKICKILNINGFMCEMYSKVSIKLLLKELTNGELNLLKKIFYDFITIYPRSPILKIYTQLDLDNYSKIPDKSIIEIQNVAVFLDDKRSDLTIITLGIIITSMVKNNKLKLLSDEFTNLNFLESNIGNDKIRDRYGAHYRSLILSLAFNNYSKKWSEYFWDIGKYTHCYYLENIFGKEIRNIFESEDYSITPNELNYIINTNKQFQNIFENIFNSIDYEFFKFSKNHFYRDQIIMGLINRELNLIRKVLVNYNFWEKEVVSIMFRSIIENHIYLLWFHKKSTEDDALSFIDYGQGNMVLYNEKLKERLPNLKQNTYFKKLTEKFDEEIERETQPILQNVKVGNWTNNTIRDMSIAIERKELHDLYSVFSDVTHGSWNVLIDKYMKFCTNPLHKRHKIPKQYKDNINFPTPFMCMNYLLELLYFMNVNYNLKINKKDYKLIKRIQNEFERKFLKRWKT